jgi:transcription elongation factor Elf1
VCNNNNGIAPQEYIWDAEIPEGEEFVDMGDRFKSRRIIVSNKRQIWTDYDTCLWLVSKNGALLKHVRVEHTHELCLAAAKNCGQSIMFAKVLSREIWLAAVKEYGLSIQWIPADKCDMEMYTEAVKERPLALEFVPATMQTYDMCMDAVSKYGHVLSYVKIPMTKDLIMAAVSNYGAAMRFGGNLIDTDIIMTAVNQHGLSLMYAPFQTRAICMAAVKNNRHAIDYVKDIYRYECQKYIDNNYK